MDKKYYSIKEIILGLRQSYISTQVKLELLKEYISYSRLKYKDVYFTINKEDTIRNIIMCNINSRFSSNNIPRSNKIIVDGEICKFQNKEKDIQIVDNDIFKEQLNSILNDKFAMHASYSAFVEKDADGNKIYINILFDANGIYISPHLNPIIKYISQQDEITISSTEEEKKFGISLDTKIPKINIPLYYCSILDGSNIEEKEIETLGKPKAGRLCEYDIEESRNKILLIKRY